MVYVVLAPERLRGVHATWTECANVVGGVSGAVYRKVADWGEAAALLRGEGRRLEPGTYAFVDANHEGGIGVVLVHRRANGSTAEREISSEVAEALPALAEHLPRLRNVLAELAAVAVAVRRVKPGGDLTIVHDYIGTGAFLSGEWTARDPAVIETVRTIRHLAEEWPVRLRFVHVNGHQSAAGGDEYAAYNQRADRLARQAVSNAM